MKIKTCELTGVALNWAVEEAQGYGARFLEIWLGGGDMRFAYCEVTRNYHENWGAAGPIIDSEGIGFFQKLEEGYSQAAKPGAEFVQRGPNPLTATMRCFVASRLGYEVDVPDELVEARPPAEGSADTEGAQHPRLR